MNSGEASLDFTLTGRNTADLLSNNSRRDRESAISSGGNLSAITGGTLQLGGALDEIQEFEANPVEFEDCTRMGIVGVSTPTSLKL
jgi:hypothetical protein